MGGNILMEYRTLVVEDINMDLFEHFSRTQKITHCLTKINGEWQTIEIEKPYVFDWDKEKYAKLVNQLRAIIEDGGVVFGVFDNGRFKGFSVVSAAGMPGLTGYLDMTYLHISSDMRGRGLGRRLFELAAKWARDKGATKLFISASDVAESQAFYRAMGCVDASIVNEAYAKHEPWDIQMEYNL